MSQARVFVPQEKLESWLTNERATLVGDEFRFGGFAFRAEPAVHFLAEVAGGRDEAMLVGRVKARTQLEPLAPEHSPGAVIIGNNAYEVVDGYALTLETEAEDERDPYPQLSKLLATP